jgi:cysteine synthase
MPITPPSPTPPSPTVPSPGRSALDAIGNTPVVRLNKVVPAGSAAVFLKLEYFNPTGSYKDRMAHSMVSEAERRGALTPGMTVVEASGGSTGSSLAFVCAIKGYAFHVVTSDAFAREKLRAMAAFGATVEIIPSEDGKISADLIPAMMRRAAEIGAAQDCYPSDQFRNRDALVGYEGIGHELLAQFPGGIDAFCGAAGVAGMVMGVAKVLKAASQKTRIIVLEPASSPAISQGHAGTHSVEGIGVGFVPPFLDASLYDAVWAIPEDGARAMCRRLAAEEGLLVGTSTGLNVAAALDLAAKIGPGGTVVTVACDTGLKYMNGSLFDG